MWGPRTRRVEAVDAQLLLDDVAQLGVQHRQRVALGVLLQELLQACGKEGGRGKSARCGLRQERRGLCACRCRLFRGRRAGGRQGAGRHPPLDSLESTSEAAACSASVVFSNLLNALSFTTCSRKAGQGGADERGAH